DVAFTEAPDPVANPSPAFTTDVVERALVDAEQLLSGSGPISAADRVHTALHDYLSGAGTGEPRGRVQICHPRAKAWSDFGAPKRRNNRPLIHPGRCTHPNPSAITATKTGI